MAKSAYVGASVSLYTPIEYIESTGTQYINTNYKPNSNTVIKFKFNLSGSTVSIDYERIFDAFSGSSTAIKFQRNNRTSTLDYSINNNYKAGGTFNQQTNYVVEASNHNFIMNGNERTFTATTYTSSYNLEIFHGNDRFGKFKLYYFQIYEGDVLVRDLVPAKDSNNVIGMFDTVNNEFYYNKGIGSFIGGEETRPEVIAHNIAKKIVKMYVGTRTILTPIEYIESSGTQYINTEVVPKSSTKLVADYQFLAVGNSQFGCGEANNTKRFLVSSDASTFSVAIGTSAATSVTSDTARHTFTLDALNKTGIIDQTSVTTTFTTIDTTYPIAFFCRLNNTGTDFIHSARFYCAKIYENNVLVRDMIPVIANNTTYALYDKVENKVYLNQGTGAFTGGDVTGEPDIVVMKDKRIIKGYVGVNGTARVFFAKAPELLQRLSYTDRGYGPDVASTTSHLIVAGGDSNLSNFFAFDTNYTQTTKSISYYGAGTGQSIDGKTVWVCGSSSTVFLIDDNLVVTNASTYANGTYGVKASQIGNKALFTGGYNSYAYAYTSSGTRTTATNMTASRYRHAQCTFNNRACVVGGGSATMDVYSESLVKTSTTGLASDVRYINSAPIGEYMVVTQGSSQIALFSTNLTRLNSLAAPASVTGNASVTNLKDEFVLLLNNGTHMQIDKNLVVKPLATETMDGDTYGTKWINGSVAIADHRRMYIYDY